jgi:hypothetical protein
MAVRKEHRPCSAVSNGFNARKTKRQLPSGGCNEGSTERHAGVPIQQGANTTEAEKDPSLVKLAIKSAPFRKPYVKTALSNQRGFFNV